MKGVEAQFSEVVRIFPDLEREGRRTLRGLLPFSASLEGVNVQDVFHLEIVTSSNFYLEPPVVRELEGRTKDYTHVNPDGTFCLGAPLAVQLRYRQAGTLLAFIKDQVIPFLFTFCYWERNKSFPYGELLHGGKGILQFYREDFFKVDEDIKALRLLKVNVDRGYSQTTRCPCGSNKPFKACHGPMVRAIWRHQSYEQLVADYDAALTTYVKYGNEIP